MAATIVQYLGTGRRKTSVARVFLAARQGRDHGQRPRVRELLPDGERARRGAAAASATETADKFDVLILANGGGVAGQAGAARLGIARALMEFNAELRGLKKLGFLTRDPRAARAQEVRAEGRPQAVPVLQALSLREPGSAVISALPALCRCLNLTSGSRPPRKSRFGPRGSDPTWHVSGGSLPSISMKELLEAGVHFGHQTKRWNPKMKEYIFGERNGIYIIDLQKTLKLFKDAAAVRGRNGGPGQDRSVRRHQAPGAGSHRRRSHALPACTTSTSAGWADC